MTARILFLDDDPVVQVLRKILCDAKDPSITDYFAPETIDLSRLLAAANGLRRSDGGIIAAPDDSDFEDATAIIFRRGEITRALLARHPRLKLIQRLGESTEDIDLAATTERGIRVSCLPRKTLIYTAEHGILLMLALAKRLLAADHAVRDGATLHPGSPGGIVYNWTAMQTTGLHGKTLGIVGMGQVGFLLAKLAHAFGMSIVYTKRRRATPEQEAAVGARLVALDELLAGSDFVSLMLPNAPENARYAGVAFFASMQPHANFINMSRGALVDEDALYRALTSGRIAGAGLDVHATEPRPVQDRFAALDNVVLTPHLAGGAKSGLLDEFAVIMQNCHAAFRGEAPRHEVQARESTQ